MGDPIQNLRRVVEEGRRVYPIHRNEWPDLWEAIDKLVGLSFTEYMFTADQYEPDEPDGEPDVMGEPESGLDEVKVTLDTLDLETVTVEADQWPNTWPPSEQIYIEMTHEDGRAEILEVVRGQIVNVTPGEISDLPSEDEVHEKSLPIDIETIALGDAEHWAMWFKAWLDENPDADVDGITLWFARALAVGEVNQHPLIEVTVEDGRVVAMKPAGEDVVIDSEDSGF